MTTSEYITLAVGLLQAFATIVVAIVLYQQVNKLKRIELTKQATDLYNLINTIALSRDENLIALDSIGRESAGEPIELRRKRFCAFLMLTALETTFLFSKEKMLEAHYVDPSLRHHLDLILVDDFVYTLIHEAVQLFFCKYSRAIPLG